MTKIESTRRLWLCVLGVVAWIMFFGLGVVVGTTPYRTALGTGELSWKLVPLYFFVVVCCYSLTNLAILCCVSAMLGGACNSELDQPPQELLARGLLVFMTMLGGALAVGNVPFEAISQGAYIRMASVASLGAFVAGYFPAVFRGMLAKVSRSAEPQGKD